MEVSQDVLLPVLLAAIVANTVLLLLVVYAGRMSRAKSVTPATTRSVLQSSLMSSSYIDESARSTRMSDGASNGGAADDADGGRERRWRPGRSSRCGCTRRCRAHGDRGLP